MLVLLPCIYVYSFLTSAYRLFQNKPQYILLFFVFGLPIYITSLSLTYQYGFESWVPVFQSFKEIIVLLTLGFLVFRRKEKLSFTPLDKLILAYLLYTSLYVILPLGNFSLIQKLLALKSLSFFPLVYFTGRLIDPKLVNLNHYFSYICLIAILAGIVLAGEIITYEHLQAHTGYAAFNEHFFGMEPSGHFDLSWTFETSNGLKRFASFYGGPLELGVNTLFTLSAIAALSTKDDNTIRMTNLVAVAFVVSCLSIFFAISRASLVSYFLVIYVYALITRQKQWLQVFYYGLAISLVLIWFVLQGDIYELIITTLNFTDNSSAFHVLQWLEGLEAIASRPLGLGLGMSGRVSSAVGDNIGGENQLIIIGVQTGVISVLIYMAIYISVIKLCLTRFYKNKGKIRKLALCLLLVKIGLIIPTLTANVESYVYIAYITWFCTGMLTTMSQYKQPESNTTTHHG